MVIPVRQDHPEGGASKRFSGTAVVIAATTALATAAHLIAAVFINLRQRVPVQAMSWFRVPRQPDVPQDLRQFLEQAGPETVRDLLYNGWSNPEGLTDVQKRIRFPSEEREHAIAWLQWKTALDMVWIKSGVVAAVVAAIASIVAAVR
jgi:hypothetical protein